MSDRLPIAVVGLGFGRVVIERQLLAGPGARHFELAAVCDADPTKARDAAEKCHVPAVPSLDRLLADPAIPVVALFTGPAGRADLVRQILRAGKHVLTTKPFELDPEAAADVLVEAQSLGLAVHLNSPGPMLEADLSQILAWQNERDLGRLVAARSETWCSYHEQADGSWYDDPARCPTAPIFRLGVYAINDLVRLCGAAERVFVSHGRLRTGRPTPDNAQAVIEFAGGAIASVFASFCVDDGAAYRQTTVFNFERGTVTRVSAVADTIEQVTLTLRTPRGEERVTLPAGACSGWYHWDQLAAVIRGRGVSNPTPPEAIVAGVRILAALARSEQTGAPAPVEPSPAC